MVDGTRPTAEIRVAHAASRGTYGAPRVHAELAAEGIRVGRKRIARLMSQAGLAGVSRRKFVTTTVKGDGRQAPDLVERHFAAEASDRLWVADITYIPTWSGFLYLAMVLDAFSRRIVGWSMATTLARQLLDALNMATRRPRGVIHHSDQGSQYTSIEFGYRCREAGVRPSMGSVGDAYDNAMCESFFATLECELLARCRFETPTEARNAVFEFIEGFYNPRRRHSSIEYLSPIDYERRQAIPTHTSLPSCSRPSRTSPSGGPRGGAPSTKPGQVHTYFVFAQLFTFGSLANLMSDGKSNVRSNLSLISSLAFWLSVPPVPLFRHPHFRSGGELPSR